MEDNNFVWWKWILIFFTKSDNFKDFLAFILIFGYFLQLFREVGISNEYMVLLGMAIGNYFKHGK